MGVGVTERSGAGASITSYAGLIPVPDSLARLSYHLAAFARIGSSFIQGAGCQNKRGFIETGALPPNGLMLTKGSTERR